MILLCRCNWRYGVGLNSVIWPLVSYANRRVTVAKPWAFSSSWQRKRMYLKSPVVNFFNVLISPPMRLSHSSNHLFNISTARRYFLLSWTACQTFSISTWRLLSSMVLCRTRSQILSAAGCSSPKSKVVWPSFDQQVENWVWKYLELSIKTFFKILNVTIIWPLLGVTLSSPMNDVPLCGW